MNLEKFLQKTKKQDDAFSDPAKYYNIGQNTAQEEINAIVKEFQGGADKISAIENNLIEWNPNENNTFTEQQFKYFERGYYAKAMDLLEISIN
jgi:uncharacterized protein YllA (UPF0747 family)